MPFLKPNEKGRERTSTLEQFSSTIAELNGHQDPEEWFNQHATLIPPTSTAIRDIWPDLSDDSATRSGYLIDFFIADLPEHRLQLAARMCTPLSAI